MLSNKYSIEIVQEPIRARMCGFGEKDRRPIDPPPIIQLTYSNVDKDVKAIYQEVQDFIVHCDLYTSNVNSSLRSSISQVIAPGTQHQTVRNLVGSLAASPQLLKDDCGIQKIYFLFSDLSVRTEGEFHLKFTLFELDDETTEANATVFKFTQPFTVYPPKRFPGMTDSTPLSKAFARQGLKIAIRKNDRLNSIANKVKDSTIEEEQEEQEEQENIEEVNALS